jgi:ABC-type transporter Mla MlaB component
MRAAVRAPMDSLMLTVEEPVVGVVVVRVGGELNRVAAPRLARLLDHQLDRCVAAHHPPGTVDRRAHLIVDLAGVRTFDAGGLSALRHAQYTADVADVGVHLTGLAARAGLLPGWAAEELAPFDGFPTTEDALTASLN